MNNLNGLKLMKTRLDNQGGSNQQNRMIMDKRRTLDRVALYSYQGAKIRRPGSEEEAPALINPNQLKQDYDDKVLSIGYEYGYKPGDVFEWVNTGTKWIIYLQDLTELAYFHGDIRKCSYEIIWKDEDNKQHITYAAIRGPQENSITSMSKNNFNMDLPNYTLNLLLPSNDETLTVFKRYSKFYLRGLDIPDSKICWRVEAVDSISTPGILEIYAGEYYANKNEDDVENGIVGGLIKDEPITNIVGETFIKPKIVYTFKYDGEENATWIYDNTLPMRATVRDKEIDIQWRTNYGGQFVLKYGTSEKTIVVDSLF